MERSAANSDRRRSAGPCRKSARDRRDLAGEVNLYRVAHAARDCLLPRLRSEEIGVVLVRDKAGFEQPRRRVARLQNDNGREALGVGAEMHLVCRLTPTSEEPRDGKERIRTCRPRWPP